MTPIRIFISSVQREFAHERERLRDYLRGDPLMRRFFDVFLFEEVPASDRRPDRVYLDEVGRCDIYVGLFGRDYGSEDAEGVSPTEREFDRATELEKHRLIFVKGADGSGRHPKMDALIARSQAGLVRRRFATSAELVAGLYASLVRYLESRELSSEVKCAHFHGTEVAKPIPSYQVYKGTVFALVDQAVDFVLGKIALSVGTRAESVRAPVEYEIPKEVVTEAIVNAVAHRDYTDNSSVQVMLFADRLEVMNSGRLPPPLTVEKLRAAHQSLPGNPLLAESMYLLQYIERMGTGTVDMIRRCAEAGLPEPEFEVGAGFLIRIWRSGENEELPATQKTTQITDPATQITSEPTTKITTRKRILDCLRAEPELTRRELAERTDVTPDGVKYHLRKLKADGTIRRVGSDRAGRWVVTDRPDDDRNATEDRPAKGQERATTQNPVPATQISTPTTQIPTQTTTQKTTQERILSYLNTEPSLTRRELAERTGITPDGIKYHLKELKAAGAIRRVGSDRAGRWEVLQ